MPIYSPFVYALNWFVETIGVAILSLFLGFILANFAVRLAEVLLSHAEVNRLVSKAGIRTNVEHFLVRIVKISAYTLTCLLVLWHLGILWYVFIFLLGASILLCVAEILINLLDIFPNALFGFFLRRKTPFLQNDVLSIDRISGRIRNTSLTEVMIYTSDGDIIAVPYWYLYGKMKQSAVRSF